jgi:hypothetical protein
MVLSPMPTIFISNYKSSATTLQGGKKIPSPHSLLNLAAE